MPSLAFTLALDFEGDQYTFYKFSHSDLRDLYGLDVQEINIWKPLVEHAVEQVALGRVLIPEVDSFWLPDTDGVSYQIEHVKTSIAIQDIDVSARGSSVISMTRRTTNFPVTTSTAFFGLAPGLTGPNVLAAVHGDRKARHDDAAVRCRVDRARHRAHAAVCGAPAGAKPDRRAS